MIPNRIGTCKNNYPIIDIYRNIYMFTIPVSNQYWYQMYFEYWQEKIWSIHEKDGYWIIVSFNEDTLLYKLREAVWNEHEFSSNTNMLLVRL